jgi:hypothetical protein
MFGEQSRDGLGGSGGFDPAHGPRAAAAVLDVGEEHVPDEPAPAGSTATRLVGLGGAQGQALLIAGRGSGREHPRLGRGSRGNLGARSVMTRQHAEVTHQVQARRRHRGAEPDQQVVGLEQDGAGAVLPDALQLELEASVGALREPLEGEWRPGDVTSEALELFAVATVDELLGVDADAERFCHGLGAARGGRSLPRQRGVGGASSGWLWPDLEVAHCFA